MESIIAKIQEIKKHRQDIARLQNELDGTLLTDYSLIAGIHEIFNRECQEKNTSRRRKLFVFIVMLFYSPDVLTGRKLHNGMRKELKKYISGIQDCAISYYVNGLLLNYNLYKDFREEIARLYGIIRESLTNYQR